MTDVSFLAGVELFSQLDKSELGRLVEVAERRQLRRGDTLFVEDDASTELYVVVRGRIAIAKKSIDGRESMMALMEQDDLFGEMAFFDGQGRSAEARALEPSEVVVIPYSALKQIYEARPELLWSVTAMLVRRLRSIDDALADSVFLDVTGRTAKRLLELAGDAEEFSLPITQEELAGMVGASRERVNKAIASFIRLGWIEQHDRRYRITDREQLTRRAI
ncbi:Crp/Fnr family transcriptional regulator [Actinomarinicola tropica]|uniref:Cyclic nucleotide-binding domain-containing protein n=1 Tax=Actinomarinicola tropica TaxID=2789776 RepID=A0A5Q2RTD3_9ACTN|nr:Crp/Fnr family transcriptional regulator [Actinomarinicola tropica]QGG96475.1 cyclic nucleotide-binding domain-containing protein [Actinomarinicola tropica]